jgi:alkanesulfonate monooxygenase SsuD/methylene tetrahydromethanopterin reductase-like flavin-dependent oxidoreductase (luciferase family)
VFSTSHVLTIHPIMAAKQATTIDHITGGRFALNIVTGWHRPEIEMFGSPLLDHDVRYELSVEWLDVVKRLWTEEEEFDFDGKYFQIKKGYLAPKPIQKPFPAVMNAGHSEAGRRYAAKYCDMAFVNINRDDFDVSRAVNSSYRKLAHEEYGRDLQIWASSYVVQGETKEEGARLFQRVRSSERRLGRRHKFGGDPWTRWRAFPRTSRGDEDALYWWMGRLSIDRQPGADRRRL